MPRPVVPLEGRYGPWLVLGRAMHVGPGPARWRAKCDCGREVVASSEQLRRRKTRRCTCERAVTTALDRCLATGSGGVLSCTKEAGKLYCCDRNLGHHLRSALCATARILVLYARATDAPARSAERRWFARRSTHPRAQVSAHLHAAVSALARVFSRALRGTEGVFHPRTPELPPRALGVRARAVLYNALPLLQFRSRSAERPRAAPPLREHPRPAARASRARVAHRHQHRGHRSRRRNSHAFAARSARASAARAAIFLDRASVQRPFLVETTPAIAANEPEKLHALLAHGVERISLGVQSTEDDLLARMNRRAQRSLGQEGLRAARNAGFSRVEPISLLRYARAVRSVVVVRDVEEVLASDVTSVTLYDCLYRGENRALPRWTPVRPTPSHYQKLYDAAFERLREEGFSDRTAARTSLGSSTRPAPLRTSKLDYATDSRTSAQETTRAACWVSVGGSLPSTSKRGSKRSSAARSCQRATAMCSRSSKRAAKYALLSLHFGRIDHERFRVHTGRPLEEHYAEALARACNEGWLERDEAGFRVTHGHFARSYELRASFYPRMQCAGSRPPKRSECCSTDTAYTVPSCVPPKILERVDIEDQRNRRGRRAARFGGRAPARGRTLPTSRRARRCCWSGHH